MELEKIYQVAPHSVKSTQTINLLTIPAISNTLLPKTIAQFKKEYPHVSVNLQETRPEFIFNGLSQCDNNTLGLSAYADATQQYYTRSAEQYGFIIEPLYEDYFACFVSSQSPLAKRQKVTRKDLEPYPAVHFAAICDENADADCDESIARFPFELYQAPNVIGVNTLENIKKLVCENVGIAVLPKSTIFEDYYVQSGLMVPLEFEENQILFHHCLILPKKYRMSKVEQAFINVLKTIYTQMRL